MKKSRGLLLVLFLLAPTMLLAGPPLYVIGSTTSTTKFTWKWPYRPVQVYTAVQTKPYYYSGRVLLLSQEDVSKYRFYHPERTAKNDWGYFFQPGVKLTPRRPAIHFGSPTAYTEVIYPK